MFDQWSKYLLIGAIALGGLFEVIKRLDLVPSTNLKAQKEEIGRLKLDPYARAEHPVDIRKEAADAQLKALRAQILKTAQRKILIPPTGQFDSSAPLAQPRQLKQTKEEKDKADKAKKAANDHKKKCVKKKDVELKLINVVEDPALAQGDSEEKNKNKDKVSGNEKEKVKEKEEECADEQEVVKNTEVDEPKKEEPKPNDNYAPNTGGAIGGGLPVVSTGSDIAGLEEWKARVVDKPNFKETVRLIELYQNRQISSELFYQIVDLMIQSPIPEVQEFGVLAAGRTPSNQSFQVLADVIKAGTFGSNLRQHAEAELNYYQEIAFLTVIEQVLHTSDDVFATVLATKQLDASAHRFLTAKMAPRPGNNTLTAAQLYSPYFKRFIVVLQMLSTSKDSLERSQAQQTLTALQSLLKV